MRHGRPTLAPLRRMDDAAAMDHLLSLPGVGPKTAACVLLFNLRRDVFPVDTHVHRICRRLGVVPPSASAETTQTLMADLVPRGRALDLHINLIRHGRCICQSAHPRCPACPCPSVWRRRAKSKSKSRCNRGTSSWPAGGLERTRDDGCLVAIIDRDRTLMAVTTKEFDQGRQKAPAAPSLF